MPLRVIVFYLLLAASGRAYGRLLMLIITPQYSLCKLALELIIICGSRMAICWPNTVVAIKLRSKLAREKIFPTTRPFVLGNQPRALGNFFSAAGGSSADRN